MVNDSDGLLLRRLSSLGVERKLTMFGGFQNLTVRVGLSCFSPPFWFIAGNTLSFKIIMLYNKVDYPLQTL